MNDGKLAVSVEKKRYFRYDDGADHYSMGLTSFKELVNKVEGSRVRIPGTRIVLIDSSYIDAYLDDNREWN